MSSSAKRALRILEAVAHAGAAPGVTELARQLKLPPGTVFRSLDALEKAGLIARVAETARYVPGRTAELLRQSVLANFPIREVCLPYLHQLASVTGETASLAVRIGWYGVRIAAVRGTNEVTDAPALGEARYLADSGAGRALLAFMPAGSAERYLSWAGRRHVGHQPDGEALRSELKGIVHLGIAAAPSESDLKHLVVSLPVRVNGEAAAAITIEGPLLDRDADAPGGLGECREVMKSLEAAARLQPHRFENPFAHLNADSIALNAAQTPPRRI